MDNALATLSHYGKSFRFASYLLSKNTVMPAARLYAFCRYVDDIADESEQASIAKSQLNQIKNDVLSGQSNDEQTRDFIELMQQFSIRQQDAIVLINGVESDLSAVLVEHEKDLLCYAYQVAGVVGLMMNPLLGGCAKGEPFAVDLGIAMQLTNIARDVLEDAKMGRRYLPFDWCPLSPQQIVNADEKSKVVVQKAIQRLLDLAEHYYQSAQYGLAYLPAKNSRSIAVASRVYRAIGVKLKHRNYAFWQPRCIVPHYQKVLIAMATLTKHTFTRHSFAAHQATLHTPLYDVLMTRGNE
jgi:phytoene synthase